MCEKCLLLICFLFDRTIKIGNVNNKIPGLKIQNTCAHFSRSHKTKYIGRLRSKSNTYMRNVQNQNIKIGCHIQHQEILPYAIQGTKPIKDILTNTNSKCKNSHKSQSKNVLSFVT